MYEQGEIILIPFPYSDLTGSKLRPALILSNKHLNKTDDRICCLITSNAPADGVSIPEKVQDGGKLPFESWIKPHRLFTVNAKIIKKKLCSVSPEFYDTILGKVAYYLKRI